MLMAAGMNVARMNFSHGEYAWFEELIAMIREAKVRNGRPDVAIALDTKGPEIRTGLFAKGTPAGDPGYVLPIEAGDSLLFSHDSALSSAGGAAGVFIDYPPIGETLSAGSLLMVDDGLVAFEVREAR